MISVTGAASGCWRLATIQPNADGCDHDHRDDDRVGVRPIAELLVNESESQEQQNCSQSEHDGILALPFSASGDLDGSSVMAASQKF